MEEKNTPEQNGTTKRAGRDRIWDFIMVQTVAAVAALLFVIAARAAGGSFYETVREWYNDNFRETTSVDEVLTPDNDADGTSSDNSDAESFADGDTFSGVPEAAKTALGADAGGKGTASAANALAAPVSGVVTSGFGYRVHPISGCYLMHGGIDVAADEGTPIAAAWDGVVVERGVGSSYGKYVVIKHTDGLSTLYAHCSELIAAEGQIVFKGETVALVGSTGAATGPHLHFEIRVKGEAIDPRSILKTE